MKAKIYRGNQIGGCVTEIVSKSGSKILIDAGSNLPSPEHEGEPELPIEQICEGVGGVFVTHYHGDHIGLFERIPDTIRIYMGMAAKDIFGAVCKRVRKDMDRHGLIIPAGARDRIGVGDITVTPFRVDHSAYDAYMYLVEADGKKLLHTGDFRTHGWTGYRLHEMINYYVKPVDCVITEGTMLSRDIEDVTTEKDLYKTAKELLAEHNLFVLCSSTNIDTIASFYHATRRTKKKGKGEPKIFVVDEYQKEVLDIVSNDTDQYKSPFYLFEDLRVYPSDNLLDDMRRYGFCALVRTGHKPNADVTANKFAKLMNCFKDSKLVYSMWSGYLTEEYKNDDICKFVGLKPDYINLHTSGHASYSAIEEMLKQLAPCKIIPIHTENPSALRKMDIDKSRIVRNTGEYIEI